MILGKIIGKVSTKEFCFKVENKAEKFQYVQILHEKRYVLAQIIEIERDIEKEVAICNILGYRDEEDKVLKSIKTPFSPGSEVIGAEEDFIKETLNLEKTENSAYIGKLSYYNVDVYLDLNKLLNKHVSVLAKSGSGKSFCASVIIEELMEKNIPVLIIDPHGEYSSLKYPSVNKEKLEKFNLKPKSFLKQIQEFSPDISINVECKPLKLSAANITSSELMHLLPAKLSNQQKGILYAALKNMDTIDFDSLIYFLESHESNVKYTLISIIEYLKKLNLFSQEFTSLNELIVPGKCTIINLKGIDQEIQEVVVYKLAKDLFNERKKGNIPPFFLVLEEAHNFIPERSFTEAKSSPILRQIFSEGRKFGLGVCLEPNTSVQCNQKINKIKNMKKNYKIITFNLKENKIETEKITNKIEINPKELDIKVYKLETETGRTIIGSEEHPFLTKSGWKKLKDITQNDFVGIYPMQSLLKEKIFTKKILDSNKIKEVLNLYVSNNKKVWNQYTKIEILNKLKDFINIKYTDDEALIIARFVGHILSDGCLRNNKKGVVFYLDSKITADEVKKDLKSLGLTHGKTEKVVGNWGTEYRIEATLKHFWILMVSLGCPVGKKSKIKFLIPNWIKKGTLEIKREFLSALFGGDGCPSRVTKNRKCDRHISYLCFSKRPYLEKNGLDYAKELKTMFNSLDVKTDSIIIKKHKRLISFWLSFGAERKNIIKLFENIGVRYTKYKKIEVNEILEYMKYQEKELIKRKNKLIQVNKLYLEKKSINEISRIMNEDWHLINRIIKNRYEITNNKRNEIFPFRVWIKERKFKLGMIWEKIIEKKEIDYNRKLIDIETGKNHNFLANSFLTHNCMISQRPSRVDKSALSQVTTQMILKITNPIDIKAVSNSVEGITQETEKEIKNIPVGTALVAGVVDLPLFVNIRPKKTKHGGESISLLDSVKHIQKETEGISEESSEETTNSEIVPLIRQKTSIQDLKLMDEKIKEIKTVLVPCAYLTCISNKEELNLLVNLNSGEIINDFEKGKGIKIDFVLPQLSPTQNKVFKTALELREFSAAELFSKSGVQFSEIYDIINILINKGLFMKEKASFKLSHKFDINLKDLACYEKIDYNKVGYDLSLDKKVNPADVKSFFNSFTNVKNFRECFLEIFDIKK